MRHLSAVVKRPERDTEHSPPRNILHLIIRMSSLKEHGQLHLDLPSLKYFYMPESYHIFLNPFSTDEFAYNKENFKMFMRINFNGCTF